MGPKRATKPKNHEKSVELPRGTKLFDSGRKVEIIIDKEIGQGGFGRIYSAHKVDQPKEYLIVKVEPGNNGPLFVEMNTFVNILKEKEMDEWRSAHGLSFLGLPHLIAASMHDVGGSKVRFLAMPRYSLSLDEVLKKRTKLSVDDAMKVAKCILNCYNYMHDQDYVHADLKPGNIMFDSEKKLEKAVLIDFGLARKKKNEELEKADKKRAHNGTPLFTSTDAHRGCSPSYRSDLEILAHNLVYWLAGELPWSNIAEDKDLGPVLQAKADFIDNAATEVARLVVDKAASTAITELYKISKQMDYNEKVDFGKVSKVLDDASAKGKNATPLKRASKRQTTKKDASKKPVEEENEEDTEIEPIERASASKRRQTAKKALSKKPALLEEEEEIEPEPVRPKRAMDILKKQLAKEKKANGVVDEIKSASTSSTTKKRQPPKKESSKKPAPLEEDENTEPGPSPAKISKSDPVDVLIPGLKNMKKCNPSYEVPIPGLKNFRTQRKTSGASRKN